MKILILPMGGIGNMLMFTPALEKIHKTYPKAEIFVVMDEDMAREVLRYCPYVRLIISSLSINLALSIRKENFDLCFVPYPSSGIRKILFVKIAGCKKIISHPYFLFGKKTNLFITNPVKEKKQHDIESNLDLLREIGIKIKEKDKKMKLWIKEEDMEAEKFFKKNVRGKAVGIHPGSRPGMDYKRWSMENYNKLIKYLTRKYKVLVFFGPDENFLMKDTYRDKNVFIISNKNIHQVASLIKRCEFFISNDSGLMHLAVSQEVPTIGIFGPTIYWRTAPYGDKNITLKSSLSCIPCYNPYKKFICRKNLLCLKTINLEQVKKAINKINLRK